MKKILPAIAIYLFLLVPAQVFAVGTTPNMSEAAQQVSMEPAIGSIQDAMKDFKNLSKKERKDRVKEAKAQLKHYKAERAAGSAPSTNTLLLVILAILLPPVAVYLHQGEINNKFWIALILTLLFWIPGVIYALITVLS